VGRTFPRKLKESNTLLGCHGSPGRSLSVTARQHSSLPCHVSRLWRSSRLRHGGRAPSLRRKGCLVAAGAVDAAEVEAGGLGSLGRSLGAASSPSTPSTPSRSRREGSEPLPSALPRRSQRRRGTRGRRRGGRAQSLCFRSCLIAVNAVDAVEVAAGGLGSLAFGAAASSPSAPPAPLREPGGIRLFTVGAAAWPSGLALRSTELALNV
jgi:hypothetical protein